MTLSFDNPEAGFASPCSFGYVPQYLVDNLDAVASPLSRAVSAQIPLGWEPWREDRAPAFLYDLVATPATRSFLLRQIGHERPDDMGSELFLLARSTAAPIGHLRIKESLAGLHRRPVLGFTRDQVATLDNHFLEYAHEQAAAFGGTASIGDAVPKLLLTENREGLLYPDALLDDPSAARHWWVKFPRNGALPNDCDILRSEFHYYRALQQLGIETLPASGLALEEGRRPSLWMQRFDRRVTGAGVERLAVESIYSLAGLVGQSQGMRHTEVLGILAELWRITGQESQIPELVADYLRRDLLNKILGNSGNHGRNIAIIRSDDGVQLAPIYDLAPTVMDEQGITRTLKWPGRMEVAGEVDWRLVCASLKPLLDPEAAFTRLREDAEQLRALSDLLSAGGLPEATLNHPRIHLRHLDRRLQEWGLR
ncbi:type II toxin-antitoxin system HipA family toxin [Pseudomonas sp. LD120]|uniref:type II toxin-antitoxin system HipA family toxin n=1 Tax=Pseudomonas sp. LD120 TaxID=485751 RepID=UPI00135B942C|nr:HipA domain-containing protein [Pseudomonas sp. LD120]KAF0864664.1 type II toxin-antitoxin system HipA family toxin [Pseudomonas sp. LD120]